jgi:transposase
MEVMFDRVAGLDVGKDSVTVCVRTPGDAAAGAA